MTIQRHDAAARFHLARTAYDPALARRIQCLKTRKKLLRVKPNDVRRDMIDIINMGTSLPVPVAYVRKDWN